MHKHFVRLHPYSMGLEYYLKQVFYLIFYRSFQEFCIMQISNIKPCWRILVSILCICILIGSYNCNQYVLMANAQWGRIWLMYINALVGCMGILLLSSALATLPSRIVRYLIICGQMSLGIMLVHKPFCEFAKSHSSLINLSCENFYFSLVVSILIFMISIMIKRKKK